jgi:uncharacterized protein YqeY
MSESKVAEVVLEVIEKLGIVEPKPQDMGKIISAVKQSAPNADGAVIAKAVKENIN